jgi:histidine ammonia-lyase
MTGYATRLAAVELVCAAQAVDLRAGAGELGRGTATGYAAARAHIPFVGAGEAPLDDLDALVERLDALARRPAG